MRTHPLAHTLAALTIALVLTKDGSAQSIDYGAIGGTVQSPAGTPLIGGGFILLGVNPGSGFNPAGASLADILNPANMLSVMDSYTTIDAANPGQFYVVGLELRWSTGERIATNTKLYVLASLSPNFADGYPWALITGSDTSWFTPNAVDPFGYSWIELFLSGNGTVSKSGNNTVTFAGDGFFTVNEVLVFNATPSFTSPNSYAATVGVAFSGAMSASGSTPITFTASNLPAGLTNSTNGVIAGTPTTAGTSSATLTASNAFGVANQAATFVIAKGTPVISTWPTATSITYGQALSNSALSGGAANVAGSFAWAVPATLPNAGSNTASATFTPTDAANYNTVATNVVVLVNKATPVVSNWPTAAPLYYGQELGSSVLSGGAASVAGSFAWNTPTVTPPIGTNSYTVTFIPQDSGNYNAVSTEVAVSVALNPAGDEDNDGLNNTEEANLGTNPYQRDTDSDGVNDLREVGDGTDPLDTASFNPLNLGLVAYYTFDGNANDESGFGYHGVNNGGEFVSNRVGLTQKAIAFDGTFGRCVYVPESEELLESATSFTISCWLRLDGYLPSNNMQVVGRWGLADILATSIEGGVGKLFFQKHGSPNIRNSVRFDAGAEFVHLALVWNGAVVDVFLNGKKVQAVVDANLGFIPPRALEIGGNLGSFQTIIGAIDDVRLYERALDAGEVASLFASEEYSGFSLEGAATKSPFDPATAANWSGGGTGWSVDTSVTHDDADSVKAQTTDGQSTYREYTVTGPAVVDFWWKVSSEQLYDTFSYSLNGINQQTISGEVDWTYRTLTLPAGTHTIRWTYTKDGSDAVGQDAGWLDDFVVYPATATLQVRDGSAVLDGEVAVDFGSADQGSAGLTKSLTFLNQGYVPIEAQLSLPQGSPFTFDSGAATFGLLIGRGESVDVPILLSGTSAGNKSGQLTISTPESATAPPSITLTGYVRGPEIGMAEGTTALTSGQTFDMGLAPRTVEFTIRNNGNVGDLVIAGISATGNFQVTQQPATTIPPQTSTTFKVLAQSTATGAQAGSISITSNAGNSAEFSLALTSRSFAGIPEGITDGSWTTAGNGGAAVWNLVETTLPSGHAGVAAVTGTTPNNGESVLSMITSGPGVLSWSWRVSTQENFDWLLCEVDGREVAGISSKNGAWQEQAIHVAGGSIVRWVYRKDSTANAGEDRGYIANAAITRFTGTQTGYDFSAPPFAKAGKGLPAIFGWLGHFDAQSGPSAAVYGVGTAADRGRFHYPISKTAKGLVQLEFSKDLVNWSGRNVEQRVLSDDSQRVVIEAAVSNTSNGFFRLYPIAIPDTTSANFNSWRQSARSSLDSVYEINRIISGNLTSSNNLSFLKANVDHLKIVSARAEYIYYPFFQTREEFASIARAITEGEAYWKLHKGF